MAKQYTDEHGNRHIESDGKNDPVIVYTWLVRNPKRWSGWRELVGFKMTREAAAEWAKQNKAEVKMVEGSEEARAPIGEGGA